MTNQPTEPVPLSEPTEDYPDAGQQLQSEGEKAAEAAEAGETADEDTGDHED